MGSFDLARCRPFLDWVLKPDLDTSKCENVGVIEVELPIMVGLSCTGRDAVVQQVRSVY